MPEAKSESYDDLIFQLGDLARERLAGKPSAPRSMARVLTAEEAVAARDEELKAIEAAMDEEESAYAEFRQAVDEEQAQLGELGERFKKAVDAAEGKAKAMRAKIASKENDLKHAKLSAQKEEAKIHAWEEAGEKAKAAQGKVNLKSLRMDVMRRQREINEMRDEVERMLNPPDEEGPSAVGIRAHTRILDLDRQMEEREKLNRETLRDLDAQAAEKDGEVRAAREYYDQAIFLLGEEVFQARVNDAALVPLYGRLEKSQK